MSYDFIFLYVPWVLRCVPFHAYARIYLYVTYIIKKCIHMERIFRHIIRPLINIRICMDIALTAYKGERKRERGGERERERERESTIIDIRY